MTYQLNTAKFFYNEEELPKYEKLGFKFRHLSDDEKYSNDTTHALKDYDEDLPSIEINSLEELHELIDNYGVIVLGKDHLTIYNNYIE